VKVKNLQRGTANAVALGEKPPNASAMSDMVVLCAAFNTFLCMSALHKFVRIAVSTDKNSGKKRGPPENQGPYKCEGQKPPEGNS
jgi:hypothetical protein